MDFQKLSDCLRQQGLMQDAAEYHGILTGMLCWGDEVSAGLGLNEGTAITASDLDDLARATLASLEDPDMSFTPLLPEDSVSIDDRAQALGQWSSGLLYGLASKQGFKPEQASEPVREAIEDLSAISRAGSDAEEGDVEETAYAELVEYVRIVAQVIYLDLRGNSND